MATPPKTDSCTACGAAKSVCCFDKTGNFASAKCSDAGAFCDPTTKLCTTSDGKWGSQCAKDGDACDQNLGLQCQTDPKDSTLKCLCKTDYAACAASADGTPTSVCVPGGTPPPPPPPGDVPLCSTIKDQLRPDAADLKTCSGSYKTPENIYVGAPGKARPDGNYACGLTLAQKDAYSKEGWVFCKYDAA